MTTDTLVSILKDQSINHEKKFSILKDANLSYSVLFELQETFKYDNEIFNMLSYFTFYEDSTLNTKVSLQNKNNYSNVVYHKKHHKRRKAHGKYKGQ